MLVWRQAAGRPAYNTDALSKSKGTVVLSPLGSHFRSFQIHSTE